MLCMDAGSNGIDEEPRARLVQTIIDDLSSLAKGSNTSKQSRLTARGMLHCLQS